MAACISMRLSIWEGARNPADCPSTSKCRCPVLFSQMLPSAKIQLGCHLPQALVEATDGVPGRRQGCPVCTVQALLPQACLLSDMEAGRCWGVLQRPTRVVWSVLNLVIWGKKSWDFWDFICLVYIYCIFFNILIFTNMSVTSDEKAEHIFPDSTYVWQNARKESFPPCFWLNDSSVEWKMVIYYECWHPGDCAFN